jgi:hypothetical protein
MLVVCPKKWLQLPDKSIMLLQKMSPKWFPIVHGKGVFPLQKTTEMKIASIRHRFMILSKLDCFGNEEVLHMTFCARNY